jgi:alpha-L-fucosidase
MGLGARRAVVSATEYKANVATEFNPAKFDAAKWVGLMKKAGQKYVILTAKHHDGFCMFKTATTPFNVVDATPFGRDLVKEIADECRRQGLEFCIYYSIGDWTAKDVQGPGFAGYKEYMQAQLKELLTNYGDVKTLWFDNFWYVDGQWWNDESHAEDLYNFVRSVRPGALVNDRCGRGSESSDGDYATPENQLRGSLQNRYFEVVMTNTEDDNWGWVKGATNYRSAGDLIRNLIDCASKGGNFVLNVGPNADGEFPPEHVAILEAMGRWTAANGEAIYGTVPAPEVRFPHMEPGVGYATKSKDSKTYYVHVVRWPENGTIDIAGAPVSFSVSLVDPLLGPVQTEVLPTKGELSLGLKRPSVVDPYATVFKLSAPTAPSR